MPRVGMLTPSSNTVLEPASYALLRDVVDGPSLHFARFSVTEIALERRALDQFDDAPMLAAAELLSHAKVDCITWNGTSASWLGLDTDRRLVERIGERTGIRATTCVLSLFALLRTRGIASIGLVTPYTDDVQARILSNFAIEGIEVKAESHLGLRDNFSFGAVSGETLDAQVADVASAHPEVIVILCTNLAGASRVPGWEARHGVPVLDSVAVSLYGAFEMIGIDTRQLARYGALYARG